MIDPSSDGTPRTGWFGRWASWWLRYAYLIVFVLALLARAGVGMYRSTGSLSAADLEFPDEQQYWSMATAFAAGEGLPDELGFQATRMPLFPVYLSFFTGLPYGIMAARMSFWLIGALAAVLSVGLGSRLVDRRVGLCAGLIVALDPFLVSTSSLLLTETLFVAILTGLWLLLLQPVRGLQTSIARWAAIGGLAAVGVYTREASIALVLMALGFTIVVRTFDRRTCAGSAIAAGMIFLSLIPWMSRNLRVVGEPVFLTTRAGISLYDGVRPGATGASDLGDIKQMPAVRDLSETDWNAYFLRESKDIMKRDRARIVRLIPVKLQRLWNPWPNAASYRSFSIRFVAAAWTVPLFAFALAGVVWWSRASSVGGVRMVMFLLLPAFYLSALHSLFVGSVRYRLAAVPMIAVLASYALIRILDRVSSSRRKGEPADV